MDCIICNNKTRSADARYCDPCRIIYGGANISAAKKNKITSPATCFKKGHRQSEEARRKMSLAKIGVSRNRKEKIRTKCVQCNKEFDIYPYEHRIGRKCCSKECAIKYSDKGKTSEAVKVRSSKKYKEWRQSVFIRDNYTCQDCGKIGGRLNADHIKPFSTHKHLRFDIDNGKTLCEDCHRKTPTFGNRNRKKAA